MDDTTTDGGICRGSFAFGSSCGKCMKCKADAFDWLVENEEPNDALYEWASLSLGSNNPDIMAAIMAAARKVQA